jgi:hypothetical protein
MGEGGGGSGGARDFFLLFFGTLSLILRLGARFWLLS